MPPAEGNSESSYNCRKSQPQRQCFSPKLQHVKRWPTHNFSSSVRSSSSLVCRSPATFRSLLTLLFKVFCLTSSTNGRTKVLRSVQHRQSMNTSSSSCSFVFGTGSLATWSRTEDRVMPKDEALRLPRDISTGKWEARGVKLVTILCQASRAADLEACSTCLKWAQQQTEDLCYGDRMVVLLQLFQKANQQLFGSACLESHKCHNFLLIPTWIRYL